MKRVMTVLSCLIICFNIFAANIITVGFKESKYTSINKAINDAKAYDIIKLAPKEFREEITINKPIIIEGNNAVIDGGITALNIQRVDLLEKYNLIIKDLSSRLIYINNADFKLTNVTVKAEFIGIFVDNTFNRRGVIEKCKVYGNFPYDEYKSKNNYMVQNENLTTLIDGELSVTGMMLTRMSELYLIDNHIENCVTGIILQALYWGNYSGAFISFSHFIKNNTIKNSFNGFNLIGIDTPDLSKNVTNWSVFIENNHFVNSLNYAIMIDNFPECQINKNIFSNNKINISFNRKDSDDKKAKYNFILKGTDNLSDNLSKPIPENIFEAGFYKK